MSTGLDTAAPTGEQLKEAALTTLEATRAALILEARRVMVRRLLAAGTATADDIRAGLVIPDGIDPKCLGVVPRLLCNLKLIRPGGFKPTTRAEAHCRPVRIWALADPKGAQAWLDQTADAKS